MRKEWLVKTLALGVVVLFIFSGFASAFNIEKSEPLNNGNTLYVGGSGEGNYTKIQDAIDNATSGDTVFVYDDSSPYFENIWINKSINLLGENKNTVIIKSNETIIRVNASKVIINGFTIGDNGVHSSTGIAIGLNSSNNTVSNNIIKDHSSGIFLYCCSNNTIYGNIIINNIEGISLISLDILYNIPSTINNNIYRNEIANNSACHISLTGGYSNHIYENNFKGSVSMHRHIWWYYDLIHYIKYPFKRNQWINNYWDVSRTCPKLIQGRLVWDWNYLILAIPWFQIDWHPAKEPYDIPTGV